MLKIKLKQLGQNLVIIWENKSPYTIVLPKGYDFNTVFSLAYKNNEGIKIANTLLVKELKKFEKPKVVDLKIIETRIEKKKLEKKIKSIQSFDYKTLPISFNSDWISVLEKQEDNQHIKNFLLLLSLNPNKRTRENLLDRLSSNFPYITSLGYILLTRQLWEINKGDELYDFLTSSFFKIKGQKKSPKNYLVYKEDNNYVLHKTSYYDEKGILNPVAVGNLNDLYETYEPSVKTVYCSNYNKGTIRQESWNIGDVVEIQNPDYEDIACGTNRLHVKSSPFSNIGNREYGDKTVLVLINPKDIIWCNENWKITCSRMKICSLITDEEIKSTFTSDFQHWDFDYATEDFEEIKKLSEAKQKDELVSHKSAQKQKVSELKNQIKDLTITKNITSEDFGKILENRIQLLNK